MTTEICYLPATRLAAALRDGQVSAREVTTAFLARVEECNPAVNAVVTVVADRALAEAAHADELRASGAELPLLHGVPMVHKDTHLTKGIRTTFGSAARTDFVPEEDELVIARLKSAGVISLGKTNTPEFAAGAHTYNTVFGVTRNPYDTGKSAGGSSGGAAVALACGMSPLADGSDMGGSLRFPAAFCNIVGLRPTIGRVPARPAPFGPIDLSTQGPMARSVDGLALLLGVMSGADPLVPGSLVTNSADVRPDPSIVARGLRLAIAPDFGGTIPVEREVAQTIETAGAVFESLGADVSVDMLDLSGAERAFQVRRGWQFAATLGPVHDAHPGVLKDSIVWNIEQGRRLSGADIAEAMLLSNALYQRAVEFFSRYLRAFPSRRPAGALVFGYVSNG